MEVLLACVWTDVLHLHPVNHETFFAEMLVKCQPLSWLRLLWDLMIYVFVTWCGILNSGRSNISVSQIDCKILLF